jgi:hypothetical protein
MCDNTSLHKRQINAKVIALSTEVNKIFDSFVERGKVFEVDLLLI